MYENSYFANHLSEQQFDTLLTLFKRILPQRAEVAFLCEELKNATDKPDSLDPFVQFAADTEVNSKIFDLFSTIMTDSVSDTSTMASRIELFSNVTDAATKAMVTDLLPWATTENLEAVKDGDWLIRFADAVITANLTAALNKTLLSYASFNAVPEVAEVLLQGITGSVQLFIYELEGVQAPIMSPVIAFDTSVAQTALKFVDANAAALLVKGIVATRPSTNGSIIFTATSATGKLFGMHAESLTGDLEAAIAFENPDMSLYAATKGLTLDSMNYTVDSKVAHYEAVDYARTVYADTYTTQAAIDHAVKQVNDAVNGIIYIGDLIIASNNTLYNDAYLNPELYTPASHAAYAIQYDALLAAIANPAITADAAATVLIAFEAAYNALVLV